MKPSEKIDRHIAMAHLVDHLRLRSFQVENIRFAYVFYESGLTINGMCTVD
jgi:hypothetical protein